MLSEENSLRWFENPLIYVWSFFTLMTIIITVEHCRMQFHIFKAFCIRIENAIASFCGFIRTSCSCKDQSREIVNTEVSRSSMVTIDLEDIDRRNLYEGAVASLARAAIFSSRPGPSPKRVNAVHYPKSKKLALVDRKVPTVSGSNDEDPIETLRDGPIKYHHSSRFSKYLTDFRGVKPPILPKEITSRESNSGYEVDTASGLQDDMEMEVISKKCDHVKVQEGKLIVDSLDGNMIGSNENHDGVECDTDGFLEESHGDSLERYEQDDHNAEFLDPQLGVSASDDNFEFKFDSSQESLNHQQNQEEEDNQSWFKQYYDRVLRRSATFSGPFGSSGGVEYSHTRKINEEEAMEIERESIHSNDEMEEDITLRSNNIIWQLLHKDLVPMHVRCFIGDTDSESSDQEDDSDHKLRENTFPEEHEEGSPHAPKIVATTSSTVNSGMQIDEIHPNKMFNVKSMDKKIKPSNAEESISCEERRDNEEENNAMPSETGKLKVWTSLDHVIPGSKMTLEDPSVSLDEQSLIEQMNLPEVSADFDIDEGNAIADSKRIFQKSGPGIQKRKLSCDDSSRRNSSDSTSNHMRRSFMRSVSFAESNSIVPNIETTDNPYETDQKGSESDDISLDDPTPDPEPNSCSKTCDKNQVKQENTEQTLDINSNAKFLLRRSLSLDPWPKPSKMKLFKKMEEMCFLEREEEVDDEFRPKIRSSNQQTNLPAHTEEYDHEFSEVGNSSVEDFGKKDSTMEETID